MEEVIQKLHVADVSVSDGLMAQTRGGRQGDLKASQLMGNYYEDTARGNVFTAVGPVAGTTIPIYSKTAQVFALWNRSATKNLEVSS